MVGVDLIKSMGGKLTSSYHPEGDAYTLITPKYHFSISPLYRMVDVYTQYPFDKIGRSWYETEAGLKHILETGDIIWNGSGF